MILLVGMLLAVLFGAGVRFFGDGTRTTSLVMQTNPHRIRFIDSIHVSDSTNIGAKIRF